MVNIATLTDNIPSFTRHLHPSSWSRGTQITVGCITAAIALIKIRAYKRARKLYALRQVWNSQENNVILHQFWRGKFCPNLSPFALKLETFMRISGIKYTVDTEIPFGPKKRKCPWITLNGVETEDSQCVIERLHDHFNVNMDDHLSDLQKANLEALRIVVDEHLFWCVITWRYGIDRCKIFMTTQNFPWPMSKLFPIFMSGAIMRKSGQQGIGRCSSEEIFAIFKKDCQVLSVILGDNKFFGGDKPSSADCSIFGQLAQIMWNAPDTEYQRVLTDLYSNLGNYCLTMKATVFPDWDNLLSSSN